LKKEKSLKAEEAMSEATLKEVTRIQRIAVIGVGKMGSWLARQFQNIYEVAVFDVDEAKVKDLSGVKILKDLKELEQFSPDLLLNAVSLQNTIQVFEAALPFLPDQCLLSDIASVKGELENYYGHWGRRFVSSHPMFGPTFSNLAQLSEENAIIISESDSEGKEFFRRFYRQFGIKLFEYSFDEHDQIIAYSLTVPFASSLVFAAHLNKLTVPGTTFRKHLQIARGLLTEDDYLLAEILFNPYSLPQLEKITQRLEFLKHIIRGKDYEEARRFLAQLRRQIL